MRRVLVWALTAGMIFLAGGQVALAKGAPGEEQDPFMEAVPTMARAPKDLKPGQAWNASIVFAHDGTPYQAEGFQPIVILNDLNTGDVVTLTVLQTAHPGFYRARIVFPHPGRWTVAVKSLATGVVRAFPTVRATAAESSIPTPRSFPLWAWVMSGLASLAAVAGALLLLPRLRRKQPDLIR